MQFQSYDWIKVKLIIFVDIIIMFSVQKPSSLFIVKKKKQKQNNFLYLLWKLYFCKTFFKINICDNNVYKQIQEGCWSENDFTKRYRDFFI